MKPAVSVIMPVYNIGPYLDACMESLLAQTFTDFEALLINDGSTDDSPVRCRAWAARDERIRVIDQENAGVAAARNRGLKEAAGEYIAFVDPDDWLDAAYLEKLYRALTENGADFAECDLWRYDNRTGKKILRTCYGQMGIPYTFEEHMVCGPTASYKSMSRKSLWLDHGIVFPDCSFESPAVYALLLALSRQTVNVREPLYYYRRFRENSLIENGYASGDGKSNNTLAIEAMRYLANGFRRAAIEERFRDVLPRVVLYRLNDILALQYHRKNADDFGELVANYRELLASDYGNIRTDAYITWGGYNLDRIMAHVKLLHDPSCRFNFSSVIAMASRAPKKIKTEHGNKYRRMMIEKEARRGLWETIRIARPSMFFMDLLEERFDLKSIDGALWTDSDAYRGSSLAERPGRTIDRFSDECEALWRESLREFIHNVREAAPGIRFIIIENYLSEEVGNAERRRPYDELVRIRRINSLLKEYYQELKGLIPDAVLIPAFREKMYFTDEMYEYGAVPQHLNEPVNRRIARRIEDALGL